MADIYALRDQIKRGRIQIDMLAPCQDMMMYSHTALFDEMLRRYNNTGEIVTLGDGKTAMGIYSDVASASGAEAT
jgi:hypothetical protein